MEIVEEARKMGWVPQEDWNGDPAKWRPAEEFVERGENILPIVKDRLTKTQQEVEELKRQLKATSRVTEEQLNKFREQVEAQQKEKYEEKLRKLTEKSFQAAQEGDFDTYNEIEDQKKKLEKPVEETQTFPVFDEWKSENDWYEKDVAAASLADGYAKRLNDDIIAGKEEKLSESEFYKRVGSFVKEKMPALFENPKREMANVAEGSGHEGSSSRKKGWNDLPKSAKDACKRTEQDLTSKGLKFNKDEWISTYFEED